MSWLPGTRWIGAPMPPSAASSLSQSARIAAGSPGPSRRTSPQIRSPQRNTRSGFSRRTASTTSGRLTSSSPVSSPRRWPSTTKRRRPSVPASAFGSATPQAQSSASTVRIGFLTWLRSPGCRQADDFPAAQVQTARRGARLELERERVVLAGGQGQDRSAEARGIAAELERDAQVARRGSATRETDADVRGLDPDRGALDDQPASSVVRQVPRDVARELAGLEVHADDEAILVEAQARDAAAAPPRRCGRAPGRGEALFLQHERRRRLAPGRDGARGARLEREAVQRVEPFEIRAGERFGGSIVQLRARVELGRARALVELEVRGVARQAEAREARPASAARVRVRERRGDADAILRERVVQDGRRRAIARLDAARAAGDRAREDERARV